MIILHTTTNTSLKTALLSTALTMLIGLSAGHAAVSPSSSLAAPPPPTDVGKSSSPVFSDDQVNGVGAFTYAYPLNFPAGRHNAQPLIGLSYSSDAPLSGGLAAGWSLNIPSIVGDTSRGTLDASGNNPAQTHYISNFRGGGKLIRQSDSPLNSANVEVYYALHDDQYIRYELDKSSGLTYRWRVKTPDGYTYLFGQRIHHDAYNAPLYRIIDPFGHVIQYRWEEVFRNFAGGTATEDVLTQIEYRSSQDAEAYVTVAFDYSEQRCGGVHGFPVGARLDYRLSGQNNKLVLTGSQQLDSITIKARRPQATYNGNLVLDTELSNVRSYRLNYNDETAACDHNLGAPLRRLESIAEVATAPVTGKSIYLPPTQFQYGDFAPAQNMRYQEQAYTNLKLPEGRDQEHFGEGLPGVSQVLIDLNGDGLQDLLRRPVGSIDQANLAYIYYNTGNGLSQQFSTVRFPNWLPSTVPDPDSPFYQNKSLGLSGQLKFYADHSDDFVNDKCELDVSDRKGSLEKFGLFDVNHDGLPDLVTSLHYDPVRVSGAQFGLPQAQISANLVPDPPSIDPTICGLGVQRVRWPSWKVRYNLGHSFSTGVDVVHGPLALPAISPSLSLGSSNPSVIIGRDGNGDFNGDGFRDRFHKGYLTPDEEDFHYDAKGFFVPNGDNDELADRERWVTLGQPDGSLHRVTGLHWQLPLEWLSAVKEFGPGNGTGEGDHYFATMTGLLDVNGDGLDDLVSTKVYSENPAWQFGYHPNNGHSFVSDRIQSGDNNTPDSIQYYSYGYSQVSDQQQGLPTDGVSENKVLPSDINLDGLVDLVRLENDGIYVYANNGYQFATTPVLLRVLNSDSGVDMSQRLRHGLRGTMYMGIHADKQWAKHNAYLDMNGDGLKDIVHTVNSYTGEKKLYVAAPQEVPFRLKSISNGKGALTRVNYTSTADQETVVQGEYEGASYTVRNPKWVVQSVEVQSSNQSNMQTHYTYRYPEFSADLHGHYALRGFKQRVKVTPSGTQVVDVYDYSRHYAGLHTEQVTYKAEDLDNPHSILINDYGAGFAALHDFDDEMLAPPKNWPLVQSTSYNCPAVDYLQCLDQGEKLSNETFFTTLNYAGDGVSSNVAAIRVPATVWTKFDDGFSLERKLRGTKVHQIRADADEYIVRLQTDVVHDYSTATRRIVAHTSNLWNNGLLELGINAEYIYVDDEKIGTKTTRYAYNELGLITHKIDPKEYVEIGSGAPGTRLEYDALGVTVTQVSNPLGHVIRAVTDVGTGATLLAEGPNAATNSDGATVYARNKQVVDGLGRPLQRYVSVDDALQGYRDVLLERFIYDDRPTYYKRVYGYAVTREQLVADGQYAATMTVFDGIGRERYVEEEALETAHAETRYHWDHAGHLVNIEVPDPSNEGEQVTYSYEYDSLGRPTRTTGPDGSVLAVTRYQGLTTIRGESGETNAPAAEKRLSTNMAGQLYQVAEKLDNGSYATTRYRYNGAGNMQHITDPEGLETRLKHDTAGRRIQIASGGQSWRYAYDHGDNMTALINPHPEGAGDTYTTRFEYDMLNRLTQRRPAQADLTEQEKLALAWGVVTYVYDRAHPSLGTSNLNYIGRLGYSSSPLVTNKYRYDAQGNINELGQTLEIAGLGDASGVELVRGSRFHSDGSLNFLNVYDAPAHRAISGHLEYEYDSRGLPLSLSFDKERVRLIRNHAGLVTQKRIDHAANSIGVNYAYDAQGRITVLNVGETFNNSRPFTQWFSYYANGMVRSIQEKPADGEFRNMFFVWDTRHQLLRAAQNQNLPGYEGQFDYDAAGRLSHAQVHLRSTDADVLAGTRVPQRDVEYQYDAFDAQRLDKLLNVDGSIYADYDYDLSGNVIRRAVGDEVWALRYDGENRLRRVVHQRGGQSISTETYYYEGSTRILAVHSDGTVRRWFGDAEVHYRNGAHDRDWYYAQLGQTVARIENGSAVEFLIQTPQGHEALSMDTAGELQAGKLYGPFGEVLYSQLADDKSETDYTREFNGKDYDRASGLHYYGHRYYDPISLMWNRADPLYRFTPDQGYDEPRRMNLYVYTLNNPISLVDPDGLDANDTMGMSGIVILEYAITDAKEAIYKNPHKAIKALPRKIRKKIKGWVKSHIIDQIKNQAGYDWSTRYVGYGDYANNLTGSHQAVRNKRMTGKAGKRLRKAGLKFATLDTFYDAVIAAETMVQEELDDVTRDLAYLKQHAPDENEAIEMLKKDKKSLQGKVKKLSEIKDDLKKLFDESLKNLNSVFDQGKIWLDDKSDRKRL